MNKLIALVIMLCGVQFLYGDGNGLTQFKGKFSFQNEEYILQDLINNISHLNNKIYVDIGAGDGICMSNTARLALNGWHGLAIEYNDVNYSNFLKNYRGFEKVQTLKAKINPMNVCDILESFNIPKDFGVLSLDIDSYDYFVLEAILEKFTPDIIVIEINEKIPPPLEFTVLYDSEHSWDCTHFFGHSISQLEKLSLRKNYVIVCLEYNNVFLVSKEKYSEKGLSAKEAYLTGYQYREDRRSKFPWNENMERLLTSSPTENLLFLSEYFSKYEGKFTLTKK